ncbi:MAG: DUF4065 domain-containing protein [Candidatus Pacebacteria bacterium]|nr:DUF4065 domain-containing protein [Candidatus Paceibacterota bacterium]
MLIFSFIKNLRKKQGYSQERLARELGVSRPTYMQIESGDRELTISEAQKLASLFGLSLEDFLAAKKTPKEPKVIILKNKKKAHPSALNSGSKGKPEMRISVPQKNLEKFREILLYILEKVGAKPNIGETAIYKLLYFIDFDFYERYEEQLIGATYIKNKYGPTPIEFQLIVKDMEKKKEIAPIKNKYFQYEQKKYLPCRAPDLSQIKAHEIVHIDEVLGRLSNKDAKELSEYSHGDLPWKSHELGEKISYESVFYRDDKYSVKEHQDEL